MRQQGQQQRLLQLLLQQQMQARYGRHLRICSLVIQR
jgi:hypothetical protein